MEGLRDIGRRLVALRRERGVSQRALGEIVGVRQQQIARWEATSYRSATLGRVTDVAEALGLSAEEPAAPLIAAETSAAYAGSGLEEEASAALRRAGVRPEHLAAFARSHGIVRMEVFGSVLGEGFGAGSDVDVLVTYGADRQPGLLAAADQQLELSAIMRRPVDLVSRTAVERSENTRRRESILKTARTVYAAG